MWASGEFGTAVRGCGGTESCFRFCRAGINRPKHQATPPSLWEIELPLPIALRVDETTLTVKRAPIEPPPAYRPEVDLGAGERVVERRGMMFA